MLAELRSCVGLRRESAGRDHGLQVREVWSSDAAVFSPTPRAPGILSEGSPRSAMKSGTWSGSTP